LPEVGVLQLQIHDAVAKLVGLPLQLRELRQQGGQGQEQVLAFTGPPRDELVNLLPGELLFFH
jgi:hypothetical protein